MADQLAEANAPYVATFDKGHLAASCPPVKKYAIITCIDARIDPAAAFGIPLGDAHVIRNAGATPSASLRDIVTSQQMLNTTEIILIKHTCCGMLSFNNADAAANISKNLGPAGEAAVQEAFGGDFLTFTDLDGTLKEEVQWLKESPLVNKGTKISGWIYQVEDGRVRRVV